MGRRKVDAIDLACAEWARKRRLVKGLDQPQTARQFLGAIRCTLGQRRDLHAGARSEGQMVQEFPEVYEDAELDVHRAYMAAKQLTRVMMDVHYVAAGSPGYKADWLCISNQTYWRRVAIMKGYLEGFLQNLALNKQYQPENLKHNPKNPAFCANPL
jgi:hypothetical protein